MGLLGHVLALHTDRDYESVLRERVLLSLGMTSTAIELSPELGARLAPGHNGNLEPTSSLILPVIPGAYALRSTANDLLNFLSAELGSEQSPLGDAMAAQLAVRRPTRIERFDIALGWQISSGLRGDIVAHDGVSTGYRSFVGFDPEKRVGVVVLSNAATRGGIVDIGYHILDPLRPVLLTPTQ
jgi:CubicO group peptidase (beta-lactamase class C family)